MISAYGCAKLAIHTIYKGSYANERNEVADHLICQEGGGGVPYRGKEKHMDAAD